MNQDEHAIRLGDADAFARWFAACEEPIRLSLRRFARQVDVEGVVQETALRVWQAAPTLEARGGPGYLLRWAVTVARHLAIDQARRAAREVPGGVDDDLPAPAPSRQPDPALWARIAECRGKLPARPAAALTARLAGDGTLSDRRLAEVVGMTFDAFRQNLARGRRLLEDCLRGFGIDVRSVAS